jgi:hypothetical protein
MNKHLASILLIFLITALIVLISDRMTGAVVEENPCRLIKCRVRLFGFLGVEAKQVGITPQGMAICHCPHEPPDVLYAVSHYRKY